LNGAAIAFDAVRVDYAGADRPAVDRVSLDIVAGEFITLVGPSGCGKTTLLRTVNRLVQHTSGTIAIDGVNNESLDPIALRRTIGYAIQATGLFPHMTVAQNVAIVPRLLEWDEAAVEARVDAMLALVRLDPQRYKNRRPRQLSGGEAQRVGVARALAAKPRVLLMDEPFGALDAIVRRALQRELRQIVAETGCTTLFVTHDVNESLSLGDRVVVMNAGRIEQIAAPGEIRSAPGSAFVAELFSDALPR
jgi:osmoprotectant transport system ATP-binding protein